MHQNPLLVSWIPYKKRTAVRINEFPVASEFWSPDAQPMASEIRESNFSNQLKKAHFHRVSLRTHHQRSSDLVPVLPFFQPVPAKKVERARFAADNHIQIPVQVPVHCSGAAFVMADVDLAVRRGKRHGAFE